MEDLLSEAGQDGVGRITLNRPRALNALTLPMLHEFARCLDTWEADDGIRHVLIRGAGERGLCAGGDIRALCEAVKVGSDLPERFFRAEYTLNARLARYPKPVTAIMDGLTMGGGIGIAGHVAQRVVTERSQLAMPETAIGFVTDVGGTYLLSRAPGELGTHLGLTGARMNARDAIECGFADLFVPLANLNDACAAPDRLADFATTPPSGTLTAQRGWIDRCYRYDRVEEILTALDEAPEHAAHEAASTIRRMSPTSLKVVLRALRTAPGLGGLEPCLEMECGIARALMRPDSDFVEGVRAALIDKDRSPRWNPPTLDAVGEAVVAAYFKG
ncbi:enoyl-CoA hydratase/isomerase family protein [Lichenicoccus sp.]|uniref:enoyl-CoA hydratase/isomerase family protein n=1 Tax=Lichenicoccus sp. TaxID=2781899 RepID=UPI003D13F3C1